VPKGQIKEKIKISKEFDELFVVIFEPLRSARVFKML